MSEGAAAFWSYAHADDDGDHYRVRSLAAHLETQFRLATGGDELDLFIDRTSLQWGDEWKSRIEGAIAGTTFFIAIITPSYFQSQECRDELLAFAREAEKLELQKLLMAVYWRTVPELDDDPKNSPDAAIRLVDRYQYADLREARLEDEQTSIFRKAVDKLAEELVKRASEAERDLPEDGAEAVEPSGPGKGRVAGLSPAIPTPDDAEGELGFLDRAATGEEAIEAIAEIVISIGGQLENVGRIAQSSNEKLQAAIEKKPASARAGLIVTEQFAQELGEPAKAIERLGAEYTRCLVELDEAMTMRLDTLAASESALDPDEQKELEELRSLAPTVDEASAELDELLGATEPLVRASRSLRAPVRQLRNGLRSIADGRPTVQSWAARATELLGEADEIGDAGDEC
jgi:hypothetical protein